MNSRRESLEAAAEKARQALNELSAALQDTGLSAAEALKSFEELAKALESLRSDE